MRSAQSGRMPPAARHATRDSFVKAMLHSVSRTLASDSEHGYNNANQVRYRVEDVLDSVEDPDTNMDTARAVLEARFALGHDDAQYMSQAVSMLWTGDSGERRRISPGSAMHESLRLASAEGMVRAMSGVIKRRRMQAAADVRQALALSAWLMRSPEVRDAVLYLLKVQGLQKLAGTIDAQFGSSADSGEKYVRDLLSQRDVSADASGGSSEASLNNAISVMRALVVISHKAMGPASIVRILTSKMRKVVDNVEKNSLCVFETAKESGGFLGVDIGTTFEGSSGSNEYTCNFSTDVVPQREFAAALREAVRRISVRHESKELAGSNVEIPTRKNPSKPADWSFNQVASPFWKNVGVQELEDTLAAPNAQPPPQDNEVGAQMQDAYNKAVTVPNPVSSSRFDAMHQDSGRFVKFARMRGLVGFNSCAQLGDLDFNFAGEGGRVPHGYSKGQYSSKKLVRIRKAEERALSTLPPTSIVVGVRRFVVVPSPSWPNMLSPQHLRWPDRASHA